MISPDSNYAADKRLFWVGVIVSFLGSLALYVKTMAATSSFWDAGEFIAAAYTMGVPHSPGTPLYVIVGRLFSELPLPMFSVAERVNLLSAVCGAIGILFAYLLIIRFLDFTMGKSKNSGDNLVKVAGALVGALFLAFSDTYWNNAIEAEVYAMSNALMGFMTWLALKWGENPQGPRATQFVFLLFYLLALSVGFHLGTVLVFSGIFFYILMTSEKQFSNLEFLLACIGVGILVADTTLWRNATLTAWLIVGYLGVLAFMYFSPKKSKFALITTGLFVLGISVHLFLKIRSGQNPSLDEGDPETWRNLYAVLRREQYPPTNMFKRKADFAWQLLHFNGYFQAQFQMMSAYVGKLNLGSLFPIALGIWGLVDQFTRHRKTFVMLGVTLLVMSLGLVVFLNFSDAEVRDRDYFYSPAFYYFAMYIGIGAASLLGEIRNMLSRGESTSPVVYGVALALIATPFFTLNHHYFSHDRSQNYTAKEFAHNMLMPLEENAILFTNGDNDTFPLWFIQEVEKFRTDVRIVNLSLLNTPWYIKQCRDNEPKAPITWSDAEVEAQRHTPVQGGGFMMVRDHAVRHILLNNRFRQPVYFSVTIPPETYAPYREYMEMEGLVYKVIQRKGENMVNTARLGENLTQVYDFSTILDENGKRRTDVYLPIHTRHLIQNYAAAWTNYGVRQYAEDSLVCEAAQSLETALEISPDMDGPLQFLGYYMFDCGDTTGAVRFYESKIAEFPGKEPALRYRLAGLYERMGRVDQSLNQVDRILELTPDDKEVLRIAVGMSSGLGDFGRARRYVANYLQKRPQDAEIRQLQQDLDARMQSQSPPDGTGGP